MKIDITPEFISGDRKACRQVVAAILCKLRNSPTGKIRDQRDPQKTLYRELRIKHKLSRRVIVDEVAWDLMNALRYEGFINQLRNRRDEFGDEPARSDYKDVDYLILLLLKHHGDILHHLLAMGHEDVRTLLNQRIKSVFVPLLQMAELEEKFDREMGVNRDHTNIPKKALNLVTAQLCSLFSDETGGAQHGLVGQLLYQVGLEDPVGCEKKRYKRIADRVIDRMVNWRKRAGP